MASFWVEVAEVLDGERHDLTRCAVAADDAPAALRSLADMLEQIDRWGPSDDED